MPSTTVHPTAPTAVVLRYAQGAAVFGLYPAGQLVENALTGPDRTWDGLRCCWLIAGAATERALEVLRKRCEFLKVIDMDSPRLRKLAAWALDKVLHPDVGGDHDAMVALNSAIDLHPVRRAS